MAKELKQAMPRTRMNIGLALGKSMTDAENDRRHAEVYDRKTRNKKR